MLKDGNDVALQCERHNLYGVEDVMRHAACLPSVSCEADGVGVAWVGIFDVHTWVVKAGCPGKFLNQYLYFLEAESSSGRSKSVVRSAEITADGLRASGTTCGKLRVEGVERGDRSTPGGFGSYVMQNSLALARAKQVADAFDSGWFSVPWLAQVCEATVEEINIRPHFARYGVNLLAYNNRLLLEGSRKIKDGRCVKRRR